MVVFRSLQLFLAVTALKVDTTDGECALPDVGVLAQGPKATKGAEEKCCCPTVGKGVLAKRIQRSGCRSVKRDKKGGRSLSCGKLAGPAFVQAPLEHCDQARTEFFQSDGGLALENFNCKHRRVACSSHGAVEDLDLRQQFSL